MSIIKIYSFIAGQDAGGPLSVECLGCICEAISNCNRTLTCSGEVCGLFRITWAYWSDAGKPVLQGDNPTAEGGMKQIDIIHLH